MNEAAPAVNKVERDQFKMPQMNAMDLFIFAAIERTKKVMKIAAQPPKKRRFETLV